MSSIKRLAATAILLCGAASVALTALAQTVPFAAQSAQGGAAATAPQRCAALAGRQLEQVAIISADIQPAGAPVTDSKMPAFSPKIPVGPDVAGLPAFCRVVGSISPEAGSDIRFEVWMPTERWDGRLNGGNSGGFAGYINYMDLAAAVRAGQAGVASDTGHGGGATSADWAKDRPERVRDYGWRGVHLSTVTAKKLLEAYYGRGPAHSYFIGCSNGGRQALMEASRFPEDYDGIVAGAPAAVWTDVAMAMIGTVQAQLAPGAKLRAEQVGFLQSEVINQCDGLDGQSDGLVSDPRQCKIDFSRLACTSASSEQCFTPAQITALHRIYDGVRDRAGRRIAYGFPPSGSEAGVPLPDLGWDGWIFGADKAPPAHRTYSAELLSKIVQRPFAAVETFDFARDPARLRAALADDLDAQPTMRRFFDRGGKLILWHGWADAAISPFATIDYHEAILRNSGPRAAQSVRLFLVPGVQHCGGGAGPGALGQMSAPASADSPDRSLGAAIQAWVERDRTPNSIIGRKGTMIGVAAGAPGANEKQRLLCRYPAQAVLRSGADPDKASNYTCQKFGKHR